MPVDEELPAKELEGPLPCPFCGKLPEITRHFREEMYQLVHRCSAVGPISSGWSSKERILQNWNTRA